MSMHSLQHAHRKEASALAIWRRTHERFKPVRAWHVGCFESCAQAKRCVHLSEVAHFGRGILDLQRQHIQQHVQDRSERDDRSMPF